MRCAILTRFVVLITSLSILVILSSCGGGSSGGDPTDDTSNVKPVARISPAAEQFIQVGDSINFTGDASDDPDGNSPLSYQWTFSGAATSMQQSTDSNVGMVSFTEVGTVTVNLVVTDSLGSVSVIASVIVNVGTVMPVGFPAFKHLPVLTPTMVNDVATYTLNAQENVNVVIDTPEGSWTTPMMRYNDLQLPPVIVARRGDAIEVTVNNNLTTVNEDTTVHWHGFKIPGAQDGGPDITIAAGDSKTYGFTLVQPAASLWFHPHAHGTTATQVYKGLAGGFILTDDITDALEAGNALPSGEYDIALLVQDRQFVVDANNPGVRNLVYRAGMGMLGDRILVNGVEMPVLEVATSQYRFRLYNASNARTYDFALDSGASFYVVGTDGGLLNTPVLTDSIMLGAGERAEIVVDFRNLLDQQVKLVSRAFTGAGMMGGSLLNGAAFDVMSFDVNTEVIDPVTLYASLPASADINTRLTKEQASVTRDFVMSMGMSGGSAVFLINGISFDINRVDEMVTSGAVEIWEISNASMVEHPFHAHAIQWQVLDRGTIGGTLSPASGIDLGWKDTVLVQPNEMVRFIGQFDPVVNTGLYMYHCHILEHEDAGMMGTFEVLP
ncbi:MAG: multicopper oxidase domain-containing protein [Gammaproteobacteria bacterium]|nr:multicopper oxidase domain-containing protein [Gammaproteobacteria bacterium]